MGCNLLQITFFFIPPSLLLGINGLTGFAPFLTPSALITGRDEDKIHTFPMAVVGAVRICTVTVTVAYAQPTADSLSFHQFVFCSDTVETVPSLTFLTWAYPVSYLPGTRSALSSRKVNFVVYPALCHGRPAAHSEWFLFPWWSSSEVKHICRSDLELEVSLSRVMDGITAVGQLWIWVACHHLACVSQTPSRSARVSILWGKAWQLS